MQIEKGERVVGVVSVQNKWKVYMFRTEGNEDEYYADPIDVLIITETKSDNITTLNGTYAYCCGQCDAFGMVETITEDDRRHEGQYTLGVINAKSAEEAIEKAKDPEWHKTAGL
jgi:hypothetical protein